MSEKELKKDWLAGNAVVAFAGALLVAQQWQSTDAVYELPFNLTISAIPDTGSFMVATFLFISSLFLALASVVPARRVPSWVTPVIEMIAPTLGFVAWFLFFYGWITTLLSLPDDQWWPFAFAYGGLPIYILLTYRWLSVFFRGLLFPKPRDEGKSDDAVGD